MAELSLEEFTGAPPAPAGKPQAGEVPLEDFMGAPGKREAEGFGAVVKRTAANVAGIGDFVWNFLPMAVGVGADIGARSYAAGAGEDRRLAAQAGQEAYRTFSDPISNPLQKLMQATGYGEDYDKSHVTKALQTFSEWLDHGADWIEKHTKGVLLKEDVTSLINAVMVGAGARGIDAAAVAKAKAPKGPAGLENRPSYYTPDDIAPRAQEATAAVTTPEPQTGALSRASQLNNSMIDPLQPEAQAAPAPGRAEQLAAPAAAAAPVAKPSEVSLEAFQIGTAGEQAPKAEAKPYENLPGGTEPSVGGYTGPGAEYEPTATKPSLSERFVELWRNDRRWTPDKFTVALGAAVTGSMLLDPDKAQEYGLLGGAALAVKGKGGMWHPEAASRLAEPLYHRLAQTPAELAGLPPGEGRIMTHLQKMREWTQSRVRNYLNKYAGTEGDPLKDVEIPYGVGISRWGALWDRAALSMPARNYPGYGQRPGVLEGTPAMESVWGFGNDPGKSGISAGGITDYLSHVGDYLRQKVSPEKLQQYDLVRAVKETKKWDDELAAKMNSVEGRLEGTEPYKKYPDKFQWVEVKSPEALKHEGDMMGHCVAGYCPWVETGHTKIYSLRDPKGAAHVTIEVSPAAEGVPAFEKLSPDIEQIKGKQNRAPAPEYLPYVQDFVKSGKWGEVRDLGNTGLTLTQRGYQTYPEIANMLIKDRGLSAAVLQSPDGHWNSGAILGALSRTDLWKAGSGERGFADPKILARLAAVGLGAAAGGLLTDDQLKGALLGSAAGLGVAMVKPSAAIELFKKVTAPDTRMRINHLTNDYDTMVGRAGLAAWQLQQKVEQLVPDAAGRIKITHAIDEGDFSLLSPKERQAADILKNALQETGSKAREAGVLENMIDNYITHLWGPEALKKIDELVTHVGGPNMSPESRFALKRKYSTLAEGKRAGLTPLTEDASAVTGIYLNSIARSMANKKLLDSLKEQVEPTTGAKIVQGSRAAPSNYVSIDHPQMRSIRVHPDIAPSLKFVFDATEPGTILRGLEAVSIATKRAAVSFSMFHAKALLDAFVGASKLKPGYIAAGAATGALMGQDDPITAALIGSGVGMMAPGLKHIAQAAAPKVFGENPYLKALRTADPKMAEIIDLSIQGGLKYQLKGKAAALEDVYGTHDQFYKALKGLQTFADSAIPGAGIVVKGFEKVNHAVDTFMWERLHAGMKLQTFAEKYETLLQNNAKAHEANSAVPLKSKQELAAVAASFTNDIFGGLNWRRAAEGATTKWGRDISLAAFSPTGRRVLQVMMFAPDWTLSTTRAAVQAFGTGTGVKGLLNPTTLADLHRQYILRSALYYGAMGEGLNLAFSGHHLWENQDPTTIDMGDGRKMQWSKHTMEPVHWITKPGQQALNKLAFIPRETLNQLMGTEYLSTSGHAPRMESRVGHVVKSLSPISVQQSFEQGEGSGIAGFLGSPIYGKTYGQRETERQIKKLERQLGAPR